MEVLADIGEIRQRVLALRESGRRVGLVPTMGALHAGHRSLIEAAKARCDDVVVSIFVNPTQFGPGEDADRYPRTMDADLAVCRNTGVELVFLPSVEEMYANGATTSLRIGGLTEGLCGPHRPGHFEGVATVVTKLFNIVPADEAYFGEKDYQQLKVIQRMVRDFHIPIDIIPCPTVREPDGLAMSSRNVYLSPSERVQAGSLSQALRHAVARAGHGETDCRRLIDEATRHIEQAGPVRIDYVSIVNAESLEPMSVLDRPARMCLAVRIGACRLIDNMPLGA